jgi:hypothetical protein
MLVQAMPFRGTFDCLVVGCCMYVSMSVQTPITVGSGPPCSRVVSALAGLKGEPCEAENSSRVKLLVFPMSLLAYFAIYLSPARLTSSANRPTKKGGGIPFEQVAIRRSICDRPLSCLVVFSLG